jgi:2-oxoglutarate dehydrogenase E1 component
MAITLPHRSNADILESQYHQWLQDPSSVDSTWSAFFEGFQLGNAVEKPLKSSAAAISAPDGGVQTKVDQLVLAYRSLGHSKADLNPLAKSAPKSAALELAALGFADNDLDRQVASPLFRGGKSISLRDLIAGLESIYCRRIGVEFSHIQNPKVREWVREKFEAAASNLSVPAETQREMLRQVLSVESF